MKSFITVALLICSAFGYGQTVYVSPKGSDAEVALKWLQGRGKIKKGHTIDSLFSSKINID